MAKFKISINRKSLQWQLLSRFFLILIALFLSFGISQYISMKNYLYNTKEEDLEARFHDIDLKAMASVNTDEAVMNASQAIISSLSGANIGASVIDSSGNIINSSIGIKDDPEGNVAGDPDADRHDRSIAVPELSRDDYLKIMGQEGNLEHNYYLVRDANNMPQMVELRKIGDISSPTGLIQLNSPANDIQSILYRQVVIYLIGLSLILILGSLLGGAVFKRTLKPLYNITKTVENITVGKLHTRLPEDSGLLEIDKLSQSFNKMLTGIEKSFENEQKIKEKMRQFVSDASHELRTPLTSIHGFVEVLLRGAAKDEKQLNSALESILIESERLTKLVQNLLMITRLDQKLPVEMSAQDIGDVIKEIYPQLQILSGERQVRLSLKDGLTVRINRDQIKQVLFNLTQNAVQHTDAKTGIILISTDVEEIDTKRFAAMKVTDNGTGIPKKHINKIFDRFFRSEFHRSRKHGGYGLGLSIVKSIVEEHGGKITVESKSGIGTAFTVYLSLVP